MPTGDDDEKDERAEQRADEQASTDAIRAGTEAVRAGTEAVRTDTLAVQGDTQAVRADTAARESETDALRANTEARNAPMRHRGLLIILLAIALLSNAVVGGLLVWTRVNQEDYIKCAAAYDQQFAEAYRTRHDPLVEVSAAMDDLIFAVAEDDSEGFERALQNYIELRATQNKARRENPFPPLPETLCGEPR